HAVEMIGELGMVFSVAVKHLFPCDAKFPPTAADAGGKVLAYAVRHKELGILGPAVVALGQADLVFAQRFSVGFLGVLLVGRTIRDVAVDNDEGRAIRGGYRELNGAPEQFKIVCVTDAGDVPPIAHEARGYVLGERQRGIAFNGDVIVVVDPAEIIELEVAGERSSFTTDA